MRNKPIYIIVGILLLVMVSLTVINRLEVGVQGEPEYEVGEIEYEDEDEEVSVEEMKEGMLQKGSKAPDFEVTTMEGEKVSLTDLKGKKVWLNFWATWCPPCQEEMPLLQDLQNDREDLEVLAISVDNKLDTQKVNSFLAEKSLDFKTAMDVDKEISNTYGVIPIPTSYVIDSKGNIGDVVVGLLTQEEMNEVLDSIE